MMTTGDERAPYESDGAGEKSRKRPFRPEINEEPQNVSHEAGQNNSTDEGGNSASIYAAIGISELEQIIKEKIFTRSEAQRLTTLLHSRICDTVAVERDGPDPLLRVEALTNVFEQQIASSTELASQTLGQDLKLIISDKTTSMENLPVELLSNIFIRLLAKQLAQMRCISKSWNALLSKSSFVKSHLHCSVKNNDQILVVFRYNYKASYFEPKPFTVHPSLSPSLELTSLIKPPLFNPKNGDTTWMKVIGSVHGLICSCYGDNVIQIWNPSLSAVSTLPPYSLPSCRCYEISFRFGFDPKTEDYKVVKLTALEGPPSGEHTSDSEDGVPRFLYVYKKWLQAEVYSMRKGSWEFVTQRFPSHIVRIFDKDEVCVDGHDGRLHWVGHTTEKLDSEMIVAFNLGSETFLEMYLPDAILDYDRSNTLGVLGGKLCVMSRDGHGGIDVWVMDEYGVSESWVKRHVFCFSHCLGDALTGFTSRDEFLIEDRDCRLVLYDPTADQAKILLTYSHENGCVYKIMEYVDSLVWVPPPL